MREHPNAVLIRQFYEAVARGDRGDIEILLAPSCSLSVDGRHQLSGRAAGSTAVAEWFRRAAWSTGLSVTPLTIAAIGSRAVAIEHLYAATEDAVLNVDSLRVFDITAGRIENVRAIDLESAAVAKFWGGAARLQAACKPTPATSAPSRPAALTPGRDS